MNAVLNSNLRCPKRWALSVFLCVVGVAAASGAEPVAGEKAGEGKPKPGVVRLVRGPGSDVLAVLEDLAKGVPEAVLGLADWASINDRLTDQTERLIFGQLSRDELEVDSKDSFAEVAIKVTLQNLPVKLEYSATSTNILFQRKRSALRAGNKLMEQGSAEHKRWLEGQIRGLEAETQEVEVEEFLQAKSLSVSIWCEVARDRAADPLNPVQTAQFTVKVTLAPARGWSGEKWEDWGSIALKEFVVSIRLPKDPKREALIREKLYNPKIISRFGVMPVDRMIWPPTPLREQFPLLDLLADKEKEAYFEALKRVAQSGDGEGQFLLGQAYDRGEGTEANPTLAAKWWEESAKSGFAPGLCVAGETCKKGYGRAPDHKQALVYIEKAAALGNPRALTLLGAWDMNKAAGLAKIRKAAEDGDAPALFFLVRTGGFR